MIFNSHLYNVDFHLIIHLNFNRLQEGLVFWVMYMKFSFLHRSGLKMIKKIKERDKRINLEKQIYCLDWNELNYGEHFQIKYTLACFDGLFFSIFRIFFPIKFFVFTINFKFYWFIRCQNAFEAAENFIWWTTKALMLLTTCNSINLSSISHETFQLPKVANDFFSQVFIFFLIFFSLNRVDYNWAVFKGI